MSEFTKHTTLIRSYLLRLTIAITCIIAYGIITIPSGIQTSIRNLPLGLAWIMALGVLFVLFYTIALCARLPRIISAIKVVSTYRQKAKMRVTYNDPRRQ